MNLGDFRHSVILQAPTRVKTAGGGFTEVWTNLSPAAWWCAIEPATAQRMERLAGAGSMATATHVLHGRYHDGITTQTRIMLGTRILAVRGVINIDEGDEFTRVFAEEVVA